MTKVNGFKMVEEFHTLADQKVCDGGKAEVPDIRGVRFREHFKLEEFIEGIEALTSSKSLTAQRTIALLKEAQSKLNELQESDLDVDLVEYADSLGDLLYVTHGAAHFYNMDSNKILHEVHEKNLTRFPANQEELDATLAKAEAEGLEVDYHFNDSVGVYVVKRVDNGKVFKNARHQLPELAPILGVEG